MQPSESIMHDPHDRKKTDKSLSIERGKSDSSIKDVRKTAEGINDDSLQADRAIADAARGKSRDADDAKQSLEQQGFGESSSQEAAHSGAYLQNERDRGDAAIKTERILADAALKQERSSNESTVQSILRNERKATDKDLAAERDHMDSGMKDAAGLLAEEESAHRETQSALTTRDELLAVVSHDLRNPIGAIFSCTSLLLQDGQFGAASSDARHWIEFIKRNADSALRLVSDLLDVERISEGKLDIQLAKHDIFDIARHSAEVFARAAALKSITVTTNPPAATVSATCDRERITQVLSNLIGNAIKFTEAGGTITTNVAIEADQTVCVSVLDTGPGIEMTKQSEIFDRFSQLGKSDRRGIGLGLYIAKKIVQAHHGRLWVVSELGHGSTFSFTLPKTTSLAH